MVIKKEFWSFAATTLRNLAEGYAQMAEIKDNLDTGVQQTFLEPLACLENKEIKSILVRKSTPQKSLILYPYTFVFRNQI